MAQVVRIRPETYQRLKSLADKAGKTLTDILDEALDHLQRKQFLEDCNRAYARLKKNSKKWQEY